MKFRSCVASVAVFAAWVMLFFGAREVSAAEGFQPVSQEELKMTGDPHAPGAPAIVLYRQLDRDDNGRTSHEDNYYRIKILTAEGKKYGDIEIPFLKGDSTVIGIHARTIRPDGTIAEFDGKVFEKTIVKAKGIKYLAKTFTLPDVQVGGIIEYYYTKDFSERYIFNSEWILSDQLFTRDAKFSLKPFTSDYMNVSVRWAWQGLPPGSQTPKQGVDGVVRLEVNNIPAFQSEDYSPPEDEMKAHVSFIYSEDWPESDPVKFWKKVDKRLYGQMNDFVDKRKAMEQAVAQIVSPGDAPEVKLRKIYSRVQQIRNTSYEIRKTEEEEKRAKEKPVSNAEELWKKGYGDGIQITWLYLALVRAAGFDASAVWAADRSNFIFSPKLMDSRKLDANMVLIKLNGKDIYCDPGAKFTPFGMLPWPETGTIGLKLDKDGGSWVTTFLPESADSSIERKAELKLSDTGDLEGKLTVTYSGLEAYKRRAEEQHEDETDRKKYLEEEIKEFVPAAIEVELTNKPEWDSSSPTMVAEFHLKVPGWVSAAGRRAVLPVGLFSGTEKNIFEHTNRVQPIYFQFPSRKIDSVDIDLPLGWHSGSLPAPVDQDGHVIHYTLKVQDNKGTLHVSRMLDVNFIELEAKYYMALRNFYQNVRTGDETQLILEPGSAAAGN